MKLNMKGATETENVKKFLLHCGYYCVVGLLTLTTSVLRNTEMGCNDKFSEPRHYGGLA